MLTFIKHKLKFWLKKKLIIQFTQNYPVKS